MHLIKPTVKLIDDSDPLLVIEKAARNCYKSKLSKTIEKRTDFIVKLVKQKGHRSIIEHRGLVFAVPRISYSSSLLLKLFEGQPEFAKGFQITTDFKGKLYYIFSANLRVWLEAVESFKKGNIIESSMGIFINSLWEKQPMLFSDMPPVLGFESIDNSIFNIEELKSFKEDFPEVDIEKHTLLTLSITASRSTTHQLVRHRRPVYSQESQRYINYNKKSKGSGDINFIVPQALLEDEKKETLVGDLLSVAEGFYISAFPEEIASEDRRTILPNATASEVYMTTTIADWRHIIKMRTSPHAQAEIRGIFIEVEKIVDKAVDGVLS